MTLIGRIQERFNERNKVFLGLDILFTLLTIGFAIWMFFLAVPVLKLVILPTWRNLCLQIIT